MILSFPPSDRLLIFRFFEEFGIPVFRGNIQAKEEQCSGQCSALMRAGTASPARLRSSTAVAAGKVAAANIDAYLGFNHEITVDVDIPTPIPNDHLPCGRVELKERFAKQRGNDFDEVEQGMSLEGSHAGKLPDVCAVIIMASAHSEEEGYQMVKLTINEQQVSVPEGMTIWRQPEGWRTYPAPLLFEGH